MQVGCLEHGRLLGALRQRFGTVFDRVCRLHSDALWHLDAACGEIGEVRARCEELETSKAEEEARLRETFARETEERERKHEVAMADQEKRAEGDRLANTRGGRAEGVGSFLQEDDASRSTLPKRSTTSSNFGLCRAGAWARPSER